MALCCFKLRHRAQKYIRHISHGPRYIEQLSSGSEEEGAFVPVPTLPRFASLADSFLRNVALRLLLLSSSRKKQVRDERVINLRKSSETAP
jgi:hypothetical protein